MAQQADEALSAARQQAQAAIRSLRERCPRLSDDAIDVILRDSRSHYAWTDRPVEEALLREIYDIAAQGPTSMNSCPARFVFVRSEAAKAKLEPALKPPNVPKMRGAPVTVIIAHDVDFWQQLPKLFPHEDRRHLFDGKPEHCEKTAFRNGTLQGAWFMIAARAVGLDTGAMSGFSNEAVDKAFFAGTNWRSNFLCNLGYADESALFQKLPRFKFDEACQFL